MKKQNQCVPQFAVVLLACGLISSLLPGFAAAQDLSPREARAAWLIEQYRGENINRNAKFGPAPALARLALNPDDAYVIESITHFYDNVPAGSNGQQFSYPGVAWVLGKYWDKFTPAQRDHLKARLKGFSDLLGHGTENHAIMKCVAAYLFAQYWPNETGWVRGTKTSAEVMETARGRLLSVINSLYEKGYEENLSHNYMPVHLYPYYALYDCAADPEIKAAADAALQFHLANAAANHFEGVVIPPANRDYPTATSNKSRSGPSMFWVHWLYWAEAQNWTPKSKTGGDGNYVGYAAVSEWAPPAAIESLARGQTVPYELTGSAPSFGHAGVSPGFWGTGTPGECVRYVYRDKLYAMGSGFFQYYPEEFYVDYTAFRAIYKSPDKYNFIECYHPYWRSDDRTWRGLNSPFMQVAQHKGTAIHIFNIPTTDPWAGRGRSDWQEYRDDHSDNLIQEALLRYPKSIDQKTEANGWIFLREGEVYIAIRPLKDYTIDTDYTKAGEFDVVRSTFAKTGFVIDIATKKEFATFEAFQTAVNQNSPEVDWDQLSVRYTNVTGDTLTATWNPPNYNVPEGERVLVRPDITVNGTVVPIDTDYPVIESPFLEVADGVMQLQSPAGQLEVEWRGKVPKLTLRVLADKERGNSDYYHTASATTSAPSPTGLVGWWKLDEKSGAVASDSSAHANHGSLINGPTWVEGRISGALHFANTDDTKIYVDIPNSPTLENVQEGDYTVAAWVWPNSLPPGTKVTPAYGIIVKQGQHIGLVYDEDGLFKMQHHSTAGYSLAKSATKAPKAWYHVTGVVSKSNGFVKIYVNGKLESTVSFTSGARAVEFGARTWKLGIAAPGYTNFREPMNGKVDDVRIYRRVLSDAEITRLANPGD